MSEPLAGSPADWLRYARSDLLIAENPPHPDVLLELLCFHAQQAVEKAIKAVILHRIGEPAAFTHDLNRLKREVEQHGGEPVPLSHDDAGQLKLYAVLTRYPADLGEVPHDVWRAAVEHARAVLAWAEAEIRVSEG